MKNREQRTVATQSRCQKQGLDKARNGPDLAGLIRKRYLDLINIAPAPTFGRIISLDDRMARTLEVRAGMAIWRLVAATDMSAFATEPQMHPWAANFEAFLAAPCTRCNVVNLRQVRTSRHSEFLQDCASNE